MHGIEYRIASETGMEQPSRNPNDHFGLFVLSSTSFARLMSHVSRLASKSHDVNTIALLQE